MFLFSDCQPLRLRREAMAWPGDESKKEEVKEKVGGEENEDDEMDGVQKEGVARGSKSVTNSQVISNTFET